MPKKDGTELWLKLAVLRCTVSPPTRSSTSSELTNWRPENWIYKRQAWSLGDIERDYGTTFQEAVMDPASGPFYPPLELGDHHQR